MRQLSRSDLEPQVSPRKCDASGKLNQSRRNLFEIPNAASTISPETCWKAAFCLL